MFSYIDVPVARRRLMEKAADKPGLFAARYSDDHANVSFCMRTPIRRRLPPLSRLLVRL
jgi:hypothetical protein